jgi:hypothetical protein
MATLASSGREGAELELPASPTISAAGASRVSPLFIALAVALACADNFADPDLWMHLLVGKTILRSGHIPLQDLYSYSAAGLPWRNHEWLSQVVLALSYGWFGVVGLKLVKVICAASTITALAIGLAETRASSGIQRIVLVLTAGALTSQMQFRPQLFTFAMLSIVLAALAVEVYRGPARLWPLIPMFALWANLHGGYTTGLGALGIASAVVSADEIRAGKRPARGLTLAGLTILCAIATLLNPYGLGIYSSVIHSISDPLIRRMVADWVSLPAMLLFLWHTSPVALTQYAIAMPLLLGFVISIMMAPALDDAPLTAIAIIFIGAAIYMSRNVALAVIAVAIPLAHHMQLALAKRTKARGPQVPGRQVNSIVMACAIVVVAAAGGVFSNRLRTWEPVPSGAVAFMKARGLHGNILNHFEWGEYLVWHLAPESRVFIDGRSELVYPDSVMRQYAEFHYNLGDSKSILARYRHDFILLKPGTGGLRAVEADKGWKPIYRDRDSVLFAPSSADIAAADTISASDRVSYFP